MLFANFSFITMFGFSKYSSCHQYHIGGACPLKKIPLIFMFFFYWNVIDAVRVYWAVLNHIMKSVCCWSLLQKSNWHWERVSKLNIHCLVVLSPRLTWMLCRAGQLTRQCCEVTLKVSLLLRCWLLTFAKNFFISATCVI